MDLFKCLLLVSLFTIVKINGVQTNVELIVTFIKKINEPGKAFGCLCWRRDEILLLYKLFGRGGILFINSKKYDTPTFYENTPDLNKFYIIDLNCLESVNFLQKAQENNLFLFPHKWLFINKEPPNNLHLPVNSRVYVLKKLGNNSHVLFSLYKTTHFEPYFLRNKIATVHQNKFIDFFKISDIKNRRDLRRSNLNISLVITDNSTKFHLEDEREKHIDPLTKLNYNLLINLEDILNVNLSYIFQTTWGNYNSTTKKYDGEYGDLQSRTSEIGGGTNFITKYRLEIVDYITSPCKMSLKFVLRSPPLSTTTNIFLLPFRSTVWIACLITILISFIILWIITKWEFNAPLFDNNSQNYVRPNFRDISQLIVGAITQQGTENELRSESGRIAILSLFVTLMFVYVSYSAKIVTLLQSNSNSVKGIQDLVKTRIRLGLDDEPYNHAYFTKGEADHILKNLFEQKIENQEVFTSLHNGVRRMKDEFYAFHAEAAKVYKVVQDTYQEHEKCNLIEIDFLNTAGTYIPIKKRSDYKELLKVSFFLIRERGMQARFSMKYDFTKPKCRRTGANFISVSLLDCYFVFLLFGTGIVLALILFIIEMLAGK